MARNIEGVIGVNLTTPTSTQEHKLGTVVHSVDGQEYVYVQANGAISQYNAVGVDEDFQAAKLTTAMAGDGWIIGFAQVAFTDDYYGFVATRGTNIKCTVKGSCTADVALYTSATAGYLDNDSSSVYTNIDGVVAVTAAGTATATSVEIIATFPRSTTF